MREDNMPFDVTVNGEEELPIKKVKVDYIAIILAFVKNWLKLPTQLKFINDPVRSTLELKKINPNHMVISPDQTLAYYSDNLIGDGHNHKSDDQVVNHSIFMYLYNADEIIRNAMFKFIYMNLHNGYTLSNGVFWGVDGTIFFSGFNVSTETLASVNLLFLKKEYRRGALPEAYEKLMKKIMENNLALDFISAPTDTELAKEYNQQLKLNDGRYEKIKLKNPATDMSPGCDADKAIVLLASLAVMANFCDKKYTELYKKYKNVYGYGIKARFSSNSLEVIISLYVLLQLTKDDTYAKILKGKFESDEDLETLFGNYLYANLIGVK